MTETYSVYTFNGDLLLADPQGNQRSFASGLTTSNYSYETQNDFTQYRYRGAMIFTDTASGQLYITNNSYTASTQLSNISNGQGGLKASAFTEVNNRIVFVGDDANGYQSIWSTSGTATSTTELYSNQYYTYYSDLTVANNDVYYVASDTNNEQTLWRTDGTAAGTYQVGHGIGDFAFLNGSIYCNDTQGTASLYQVSVYGDTKTPLSVAGASASYGLDPQNFMAFKTGLVFEGFNTQQNASIWFTDGTAAGTVEIAGSDLAGSPLSYASGANVSFSSGGVQTMAVLGARVVFEGRDRSNVATLFSSDGTQAGTTEILPAGVTISGYGALANLGNKVVFQGIDGAGHKSLWVTDGTAAGTAEISPSGANPSGLFDNQTNGVFSVHQGVAYFDGKDTSGFYEVWRTDGTTAGTYRTSFYDATNIVDLNTTPANTFDGSNTSDVLLSDGQGSVIDWITRNGTYASYNVIGNANGYTIAGTGDFNGDSTTDVLLRNPNGTVAQWALQNGAHQGTSVIGNAQAYGVVGTGDFNADGTTDVLLRNGGGNVIDWMMRNGAYQSYNEVGNAAGYGVVGTGDFNDDGTSDVLLENGSGAVIDWMMQGGTYQNYNTVGNASGYGVVGKGDFNGDGTTDILLENGQGNVIDWMMQNGQYAGYHEVGNAAGYGIVATGDYNGDGTTDVLLENSSHQVIDWTMQNGTYAGYTNVGNAGSYAVRGG